MSAYLMYLDPSLEEAVLMSALTLDEAWEIQDQMLLQQSEYLALPAEWHERMMRWRLAQTEPPEGMPLQ
jgi:hypothetical protein